MHAVRALFLFEVLVNAISGPLMIVAPELAFEQLLGDDGLGDQAAELGRWFGCMCFTFGAVLLYRALHSDPSALKLVLEAFLVGDVLYTSVSGFWSWRRNLWTAGAIFNTGFSVVLGLARLVAIKDIRTAALPEPAATNGKTK
jgi:hypothetical protein